MSTCSLASTSALYAVGPVSMSTGALCSCSRCSCSSSIWSPPLLVSVSREPVGTAKHRGAVPLGQVVGDGLRVGVSARWDVGALVVVGWANVVRPCRARREVSVRSAALAGADRPDAERRADLVRLVPERRAVAVVAIVRAAERLPLPLVDLLMQEHVVSKPVGALAPAGDVGMRPA